MLQDLLSFGGIVHIFQQRLKFCLPATVCIAANTSGQKVEKGVKLQIEENTVSLAPSRLLLGITNCEEFEELVRLSRLFSES